ncbi:MULTISPECIES: DsbA family protein [Brachybacterium]|uniref:DsbA family protein n=1 Tax=Brachybacterium kimchii TaxID=2942909 RepID=A0ABY4N7S9_9MICO|nr:MULTISPECIES: thioredoxin domain-containing protein [Brachybacterium]MCG7308018.1 DsbA family protein [Brachybacterium sp. ACRRE]UQN30612.1 DsbA family protein [Brachybacterium kimchii]
MSRSTKLTLGLIAVAALMLTGFLIIPDTGRDAPATEEASDTASPQLLREDSPRLSEGSSEVVFVEYLDFECEACLSLYPTVEELRAEYGDKVTFVVRYLPLHGNSTEAAQAAEAAKDQGAFEEMYKALFDNATEWGHQQTSQRELFFSYAEEIGLDMERFEQVYDDPSTAERIEQSAADAQALGVTGTPTFFVDGKRLEPTRVEDLTDPLDAALAG